MKFVVFTLLAVIGGALAGSELTSSEERYIQSFVNDYRGEAKEYVKNAMTDISEAICEDKNTDLQKPLEEVISRAEEIDTKAETVCSLIKNHLVYVLDPLSKAIDACLPNDEAGVTQFAVKAVVSAISYLCDLNGEHILELVNPCIEDVDVDDKCIERVVKKWTDITSSNTSFKEEACGEYVDIRPCLDEAIGKSCKLQLTKDSIIGLIDAAFKTPCEA